MLGLGCAGYKMLENAHLLGFSVDFLYMSLLSDFLSY